MLQASPHTPPLPADPPMEAPDPRAAPHRQVLKFPKQILEFPWELLQDKTPWGAVSSLGGRGAGVGGPAQPLTSQVSRRRLMAALLSPMTMA